jgi:hypothetical protein
MSRESNNRFQRPLKQPSVDLNEETMNPLLKKMINKMNSESFMMEENNVFVRLENYKKKKGSFDIGLDEE